MQHKKSLLILVFYWYLNRVIDSRKGRIEEPPPDPPEGDNEDVFPP